MGHGSRNEVGTAEFLALASQLPLFWPDTPIEACFLELQQPDIGTGIRNLLAKGVTSVVVAPLLLFAAGHAREDIPAAVAVALADFPAIRAVQAEPLDCHPEVLSLADLRLRESVDLQPTDRVIIVARGTSDPTGLAAVERFVAARQKQLPQNLVEVAYMAAAEPRLAGRLAQLADEPQTRVILQPHLLFEGEVVSSVRALAAEFAPRFADASIPVADHLGAGILTSTRETERLVLAYAARISMSLVEVRG